MSVYAYVCGSWTTYAGLTDFALQVAAYQKPQRTAKHRISWLNSRPEGLYILYGALADILRPSRTSAYILAVDVSLICHSTEPGSISRSTIVTWTHLRCPRKQFTIVTNNVNSISQYSNTSHQEP